MYLPPWNSQKGVNFLENSVVCTFDHEFEKLPTIRLKELTRRQWLPRVPSHPTDSAAGRIGFEPQLFAVAIRLRVVIENEPKLLED